MHRNILYIIAKWLMVAVFVWLLPSDAWAAKAKAAPLPDNLDSKYGKWLDLPTTELVNRGRNFLYVRNCPDSALVCFSIAASRYKDSMSAEEKMDMYQAYTGKWYAQFFNFHDFPKAYESLLEAKKISEDIHRGQGMANFNLAIMYQMFSVDGRDKGALQNAGNFIRAAFDDGMVENDTNAVHMAFSNMVSSVQDKKSLDELGEYVQRYKIFNKGNETPMTHFNILLYSINSAIANEEYQKALTLLDRQLEYISPEQPRYMVANIMSRANVYKHMRNFKEAEHQLEEAEKLSRAPEMKDVLLNIYDAKRDLYKVSGDEANMAEAYHQYLSMKDTLLNYSQISGFNHIDFLSEMEKMDDTLAQIEYRRQIQLGVTILCIAVVLVVLFFLFTILRKNKKLSAANRSLYEKNKIWLEKEEQERGKAVSDSSGYAVADTSSPEDISQSVTSDPNDREKNESILKIIKEAANNSEEIYSPKFTISKFSEIVGLPTKQVSQVINEMTGDNFNSFINRYRIIKACHMLDDVNTYGSLTIENIALSVGFRSRTAFISSFKKSTGLNPSDYLKAARQSRLSR